MAWIPAVAGAGAAAAASSGRRSYNGNSKLAMVVLLGIALVFLALFGFMMFPMEALSSTTLMFIIAAVVIGIGVIFVIVLAVRNYEREEVRSGEFYRRQYQVPIQPRQPIRQAPARREYERYPPELYCSVCGESITSDAAFCPHCGVRIHPICPKCEKPLEDSWTTCPYCGSTLAKLK